MHLPVICLLGIYPYDLKTKSSHLAYHSYKLKVHTKIGLQMFIAVVFTIIQGWKLLKCSSVEEWINILWYIYTMEFYSSCWEGQSMAAGSQRSKAEMFWMEGLMPKLDPKEMKQKMHEDLILSIRNFLIYVALQWVTPFILKKLGSIWRWASHENAWYEEPTYNFYSYLQMNMPRKM